MNYTKCLFMGEFYKKKYVGLEDNGYYINNDGVMVIGDKIEHIEWKKIHECEIYQPPFTIGEEIYIPELNEKVKISDISKSTHEEMIYFIQQYKCINEEEYNILKKDREIKYKKEIEEYNKLSWWKKIFR